MSDTAAKRMRGIDYFDLSVIGATHGLSDGFSSILVPVLALIVAELGLTPSRTGLLLGIANVSAFLVIFPASLIADYGGRRKLILLISMSVASFGFVAMRWAYSFGAIAALAFAAGAGNAVYHPCGTALAAERFSKNRAFAISFHSLMGNIGASLMPITQAAVAAVSGWRPAIVVCSLPALVLLPIVAVRFPGGGFSPAERSRLSLRDNVLAISQSVVRNKVVLTLAIVYALKGMGAKAMTGFIPLYATEVLGMSTTLTGTGLTIYFGAGIAAKPVMGYLYSRWGARTALAVPLVVSGLIAVAIGFSPAALLLLIFLAVAGIAGPISPIILTAASDFADRKALASSVGFIYTCYGLGFLSPIAGGWLAEAFGLSAPSVLSALLIWSAAVLSLWLPGKYDPQRTGIGATKS